MLFASEATSVIVASASLPFYPLPRLVWILPNDNSLLNIQNVLAIPRFAFFLGKKTRKKALLVSSVLYANL